MREALFELAGVSRFYRRGDSIVRAVDGVDLTIGVGEFVALEGPSGSGKTTLLQVRSTARTRARSSSRDVLCTRSTTARSRASA